MTQDQAGLINPSLPQATPEYDMQRMQQIVRALEENFRTLLSGGLVKGSTLFLLGVPDSGAGLRPGFVYQDGGVLKIVRQGDQFPDGLAGASAIGDVTVSTP